MANKINWTKLRKNIPNEVKLSSKVKYEVLWVNEFEDKEQHGETRYVPAQIILASNRGDKEVVHTLFHEWLHALDFEKDIKLTEKQVIKIEKGFHQLFNLIRTLNKEK